MSGKWIELTVSFEVDEGEVADLLAALSLKSHVYLSFSKSGLPNRRVRLESLVVNGNGCEAS